MGPFVATALIGVLAFAVTTIGALAWFVTDARGSGEVIAESRRVGNFDAIALGGTGTLTIVQGAREGLTIEAEDNIVPRITTEVRGGRLRIGYRSRWFGFGSAWPTEPVTFTVTVRELAAVHLSGPTELRAADLEADRLAIAVRGPGKVTLDRLTADTLDVSISGSGTVRADGAVRRQAIGISGPGEYHAAGMASQDAAIRAGGSSKASVRVSDTLAIRLGGAGSVEYIGNPRVDQDIAGSSKVRRGGELELGRRMPRQAGDGPLPSSPA